MNGKITDNGVLRGSIYCANGSGSGADGYSPTITEKVNTNTEYILTINDKNGSYDTPNLKGTNGINGTDGINGQNGTDGQNGADGVDGFSPTIIEKTNTDSEYVLTINNKNGSYDTPNLKVISSSGSDTSYVLPIASENTLGGVKIGSNLSIDENGVLSATSSGGSGSSGDYTKYDITEAMNGWTISSTNSYCIVDGKRVSVFYSMDNSSNTSTISYFYLPLTDAYKPISTIIATGLSTTTGGSPITSCEILVSPSNCYVKGKGVKVTLAIYNPYWSSNKCTRLFGSFSYYIA